MVKKKVHVQPFYLNMILNKVFQQTSKIQPSGPSFDLLKEKGMALDFFLYAYR